MPILPGSTIGILGSGQLGRMLAMEARKMGYKIAVFAPDAHTSPAGALADLTFQAPYTDLIQLVAFADAVDVVTLEFENIPTSAIQAIKERGKNVFPDAKALETAQDRTKEKTLVKDLGFEPTPFHSVNSQTDLDEGIKILGLPSVLKTAREGYDGKGQLKIETEIDAQNAFEQLGNVPCILEKFIELDKEVSLIAARNEQGDFAHYGLFENTHKNHILATTVSPSSASQEIENQAVQLMQTVMDHLNYVGVLCIEFFITKDNKILFNEMAPRPHNSGHLTIEAFTTSQFEQQLRAVCGLPLGSVERTKPAAAMTNLLGDLWEKGEPDWSAMLANNPDIKLHLYGKANARPGRKMSHLTALANTPEKALESIQNGKNMLSQK